MKHVTKAELKQMEVEGIEVQRDPPKPLNIEKMLKKLVGVDRTDELLAAIKLLTISVSETPPVAQDSTKVLEAIEKLIRVVEAKPIPKRVPYKFEIERDVQHLIETVYAIPENDDV